MLKTISVFLCYNLKHFSQFVNMYPIKYKQRDTQIKRFNYLDFHENLCSLSY